MTREAIEIEKKSYTKNGHNPKIKKDCFKRASTTINETKTRKKIVER